MVAVPVARALERVSPSPARQLSKRDRERMIGNLIWTSEVEGIRVTRKEAEAALNEALSKPLPEI